VFEIPLLPGAKESDAVIEVDVCKHAVRSYSYSYSYSYTSPAMDYISMPFLVRAPEEIEEETLRDALHSLLFRYCARFVLT
jgi:hypothetical protein